jgi:hypothetical protein
MTQRRRAQPLILTIILPLALVAQAAHARSPVATGTGAAVVQSPAH